MKRRVLALYKSSEGDSAHSNMTATLLEQPLDALGLVTDYHDVDKGLPRDQDLSPYAGVVTFYRGESMDGARAYGRWLARQPAQGRRVVIFNNYGAFVERNTGEFLRFPEINHAFHALGLEYAGYWETDRARISSVTVDSAMMSFEEPLHAQEINAYALVRSLNSQNQSFLVLRRNDMPESDSHLVVATPQGGFAFDRYLLYRYEQGGEAKARWHVNPYAFLAKTLGVENNPRLDVASLNGRRLWMAHIDGDGFTTPSDSGLGSGEVIYEDVLKHFKSPISASLITQEVLGNPRAETLARKIFALPHVEPASHSQTHPLDWRAPGVDGPKEVRESFTVINERWAPPDKPARLMTWSGIANPSEETLAALAPRGGDNINGFSGPGGFANRFDPLYSSRSNLNPLVARVGEALQFNNRAANDFVMTEGWNERFLGHYKTILATFWRTSKNPEIPVHVYFHWFSGQKAESLGALTEVMRQSLAGPVAPVFVTDYIDMVRDFRQAKINRISDNEFEVANDGRCRTLVFPGSARHVDVADSQNVLGYGHRLGSLYVYLDETKTHRIVLSDKSSPGIFVRGASGLVEEWTRDGDKLSFVFRGFGPSEVRLARGQGRRTFAATQTGAGNRPRPMDVDLSGDDVVLRFEATGSDRIELFPAGRPKILLASLGSPALLIFLALYGLWFMRNARREKTLMPEIK